MISPTTSVRTRSTVCAKATVTESSILYSEMLTDYERIGDHMLNIGEAYDAIQWNSDKAAALAEE